MRTSDFGTDFVWGVASAAFQIEGAPDVDGKRPSVWDEMARTGRIAGEGGADGIDFYHRYNEDIDLISSLGFGANRISLSWPRLIGNGRDRLNEKGAEFYPEPEATPEGLHRSDRRLRREGRRHPNGLGTARRLTDLR